MSDNGSRWEIDTINHHEWYWTSTQGVDFIIELVHEIERLQTENIRLNDFNEYLAEKIFNTESPKAIIHQGSQTCV